jgi:hypothetical protein
VGTDDARPRVVLGLDAGEREDPRADDDADAEAHEVDRPQPALEPLRQGLLVPPLLHRGVRGLVVRVLHLGQHVLDRLGAQHRVPVHAGTLGQRPAVVGDRCGRRETLST